jgi:Transposase domain (DUF772)
MRTTRGLVRSRLCRSPPQDRHAARCRLSQTEQRTAGRRYPPRRGRNGPRHQSRRWPPRSKLVRNVRHPGLPTRLVAGLIILKHMHNLSDEVLCARSLENPYYQFFCGELSFCHGLPFDRSSLTHWRLRLGEEPLRWFRRACRCRTRPGHWRRPTSSGWSSTRRFSPKRLPIRPMPGCPTELCRSWSNWRACHCGKGRRQIN